MLKLKCILVLIIILALLKVFKNFTIVVLITILAGPVMVLIEALECLSTNSLLVDPMMLLICEYFCLIILSRLLEFVSKMDEWLIVN